MGRPTGAASELMGQPEVDALAHVTPGVGWELQVQRPADWDQHVRTGRILEQVLDLARRCQAETGDRCATRRSND